MLLPLLSLWVAAEAATAPASVTYPDSKYHRVEQAIYFAQPGAEKFRLRGVDPASFVAFPDSAFDFAYRSSLAADRGGFFQSAERIPFPNAHRARLLAAFNNGDCSFLFSHTNRLYRINHNQHRVEPVAGRVKASALRPYGHGDPNASPAYFTDGAGVFFFDLEKNTMVALPKANPKTFQAHVETYGFDVHWGTDGKHVFAYGSPLAHVHAPSFTYVGWVYAKDAKHVYLLDQATAKVIPGANPKTFEVVKGHGVDATDGKHDYKLGKPVN